MSQWYFERPPPVEAEWRVLEGTLGELRAEMRRAEQADSTSQRRAEAHWPVWRLNHQRTRFVHQALLDGRISKATLKWAAQERLVDGALLAMWQRQGYEHLCCMRCVQAGETAAPDSVCICRVPRHQRADPTALLQCQNCGCRGCASCDISPS